MAHVTANNRAFRRATLRAHNGSTVFPDDANHTPPRTPRSSPILWQETQHNSPALASDLLGKLALRSESIETKHLDQRRVSDASTDENPNTKNNENGEDLHKKNTQALGSRRISAFQMAPSVNHFRTQVFYIFA